jgi:ornithine cyclodeaminase/alanine dehydrogenase-like protein (mu-crystallin family)
LDKDLLTSGSLFVETRAAFSPPPVGCDELQDLDPQSGTELGEVVLGTIPGRTSREQITVYKSMGHAMEDVVTASLVYQAAMDEGLGAWFDLAPQD